MDPEVRLEVDAAKSSFKLNEVALNDLLTGPLGPVAKDLSRRAIRVESAAKINASGRPGPNVRTGRLRASITWRLGTGGGLLGGGIYADIGTAVSYAPYVEARYPYLLPALDAAR